MLPSTRPRPALHASGFPLLLALFALTGVLADARAVVPLDRVGDVDGDGAITARDARLALRDALELIVLPPDQREIAALGQSKPSVASARILMGGALHSTSVPWLCMDGAPGHPTGLPDGTMLVNFVYGGHTETIAPDGSRTPYVETGGAPAAIQMRPDGSILMTDAGRNRILEIAPDRSIRVLVDHPESAFPGINDLVEGPDGRIYFTHSTSGNVYLLPPGDVPKVILSRLNFPNGVALTKDGVLLVAEMNANRIVAVRLGPDGLPVEGSITRWAQMPLPDSMEFDGLDRLWVSSHAGGVRVFDREGNLLRSFNATGGASHSLGFGPPGSKSLLVTSLSCIDVLKLPADDPLTEGLP